MTLFNITDSHHLTIVKWCIFIVNAEIWLLKFMRFHPVNFENCSGIIFINSLSTGGDIVYQCGDKVLYGVHSICEIIAVELRKN